MKRNIATILILFMLGGLALPLTGCGSDSASAVESQIVTVQRGDLTLDITAAGNLAFTQTEDLPINLFYQGGTVGRGGTVGEVLVKVGDTVKKDQLLVRIDQTEWDDELTTLEDAITTQERNLLQAEVNLQSTQQSLKNAQDSKATKDQALLNAQISLEQALNNLDAANAGHDWTGEYDLLKAALDKTKTWYQYILGRSQNAISASDYELTLEKAKQQQQTAQTNYDNFIAAYDSHEISIAKKQLTSAQMSLAAAQVAVAGVAQTIDINQKQVTLSEGKISDAEKALADAKKKLATAQGMSPEIKAPFDGFITAINVKAGDNVYNGTIAATIADPNKFEANILVSEMDISQVKLGGEARVSVDTMQGISLPAKVTFISPTATISSGVVNYSVKVELQSLESVPEGFQLRQGLTVTVSVIVAERKNVLLVPKAAITSEAGQNYVQVVSSTGTLEKRAVKTGITDYKNTEITEGLNEGEKLSITQSAKTTTTTTTQKQQQGGMMIPGMGGPPPPGG